MANEKTRVTKDGVTKTIQKKDLPDYVSLGWIEVKANSVSELKKMY